MFEGIRKDVLIPLKKLGVESMIYGGYPRDTLLGKPWKDIDLAVQCKDIKKAENFFGVDLSSKLAITEVTNSYASAWITQVFEFKYGKWPINLISVIYDCDEITSFEPTIDLGICTCAISATEEYFSKQFHQDVADQQITLLHKGPNPKKVIAHWTRLYKKYPWPLRPHKRFIK